MPPKAPIVLAALALLAAPSTAEPTLILALDGVGYHQLVEARNRGAFAGWDEPRPLVSTFPSMTNVAFVAILSPLGSEPMPGYELRHYEYDTNEITGSSLIRHKKNRGSWRTLFDRETTSILGKAGGFLWPVRRARRELKRIEKLVLDEPSDRMLGLVSATDGLAHLTKEEKSIRLLVEFAERLDRLREEYARRHGEPLRIVLVSDHGNGGGKIEAAGGVGKLLKRAGLRPSKRLSGPNDVVLVSYGVCGYGALYLAADRAEVAARAVLGHPGAELAAWVSAEGEMRVLGSNGEAVVRWAGVAPNRRLAYDRVLGDPLRLAESQAEMAAEGRLDAQGFGSESDWFEATAGGDYPDALTRLVDGLDGRFVENAATVLFSYAPGYALGLSAARKGAWLLGGKIEATHGALDRVSTWGVFLTTDGSSRSTSPIRADEALSPWADSPELRAALRGWHHGSALHRPRVLR